MHLASVDLNCGTWLNFHCLPADGELNGADLAEQHDWARRVVVIHQIAIAKGQANDGGVVELFLPTATVPGITLGTMSTIIPNIWCNSNAREMAEFYVGLFRNSEITGSEKYPTDGLPKFQQHMAGQDLTVDIALYGRTLSLINADDTFRPGPALSFMVNFDPAQFPDAEEYLRLVWEKLIDGGQLRMPLDAYPFSPLFGWVEDRYGVNWQLILTKPDNEPRPHVIPALMFCGSAQDRCAEAVDFYCDVIPNSQVGQRVPFPDNPKAVMFSEFQLADDWFVAMDSGGPQDFTFTGGVSLMVTADGQAEVDRLWDALADQEQPCGWCVDRFGLAWQVIPENFGDLMSKPGSYATMMTMTKIEIDKF